MLSLSRRTLSVAALALLTMGGASLPVAAQHPVAAVASPVVIQLGEDRLTSAVFESVFARKVRDAFYHKQPPAEELQAFREEVALLIVSERLVANEVERRQVAPVKEDVERELAGYEKQYAASPRWQAEREARLPQLRGELERRSRLARLERDIRGAVTASDAEVRAFYDAKPELFVEPEKLRVSVILLRVDPSSTAEVWRAARDEAQVLVQQLLGGASFEEAARLRSADASAAKGGDLGALHRGTLPQAAEDELAKLSVGGITPPVRVLQGVAVYRLNEIVPAAKREFADVSARARDLLVRDKGQQAWTDFVETLRRESAPQFSAELFPGLAKKYRALP